MAAINDLALDISGNGSERTVHVTGKLLFDPAEAGKQFKLRIELFGKDSANDDEPGGIQLGEPAPIYTFSFGTFPLLRKYKLLTAQAGETALDETRQVKSATLNEDPGKTTIQVDINTVIQIPHDDEVYARATLAQEAAASSNVVELLV